ncbi:MAG: IS21 family transposase [Caldilineaceae bacterium]|nr:IS21 family transposase [Caldilineaceae bacterium]
MDVREIIHRLRAGESKRKIASDLQLNWRTVKKYASWADEEKLLVGELPCPEELQKRFIAAFPKIPAAQNQSSVSEYHEYVVKLRKEGVEIAAIRQRLRERGYAGSYASVHRYVSKLEPLTPDATVRVECKPGEEAQVDFGYAGKMIDPHTGELRKSWAFVMTLSWSRHQYVEFVFDQKIATWLRLHRNAFRFFGGVPKRLVIDNLKAAIVEACWHDPQVQQSYQECAEHYGFLIAPCRPRTPQHKGKVEKGGVHYVKRNFLGGRESTTISQANRDVLVWCETTAGQRVHGTTKEKPLERFSQTERAALRALPAIAYDLAVWKEVKLHRDCHVVFDNAYYSAPFTLVGQKLRVRGGSREIRIYTQEFQLVATHARAEQPGQRQTHPEHLPPELLDGLFLTRETCQSMAEEVGPATAQVTEILLGDPVLDKMTSVRRLLKLRERFGDERLEAACLRALTFDDPRYMTIRRILETGRDLRQDDLPPPEPASRRQPAAFVRSAADLVGHLFGGATWN